jgi:hypothetical protein
MSSSAARKHAPVIQLPLPAPTGALISPIWDILLVGGISIGMYLLMSVSFRPTAPDNTVAMFVFNLSFLFNFPHFLVSYQLLYGDFRKEIFRDFKFFWAAVVAPLILFGVMLSGFVTGNPKIEGYVLNSMYFFVGWHYIKQTFGAVVVTNALRKIFYNNTERMALKFNLYSLWMVSFCAMNSKPANYSQLGIPYYSLEFPDWTLKLAFSCLIVSALTLVITHLKKYVRDGVMPTPTAMFAYATIYLWLLPILSHPMYAHMIPLFHSLQYLTFVYAFRKNKVETSIEDLNTPEGRKGRLEGLWGYLTGSIILGALAFHFIPSAIDTTQPVSAALFGTQPMVFFATIFINIHHYFIDNVIWRGNNPEIRKHLFKVT